MEWLCVAFQTKDSDRLTFKPKGTVCFKLLHAAETAVKKCLQSGPCGTLPYVMYTSVWSSGLVIGILERQRLAKIRIMARSK